MQQKIIYLVGITILIVIVIGLILKYYNKQKEGFSATSDSTDVEALRNVASLYNSDKFIVNNGFFTGGNVVVGPSENAEDGQRFRVHSYSTGGYIDVQPAVLTIRGFDGSKPVPVHTHNSGDFTTSGKIKSNKNIEGNQIKVNSISTKNTDITSTGWTGHQFNGGHVALINSGGNSRNNRIGFGLHDNGQFYFLRLAHKDQPQDSVNFSLNDLKKLKGVLSNVREASNQYIDFNNTTIQTHGYMRGGRLYTGRDHNGGRGGWKEAW